MAADDDDDDDDYVPMLGPCCICGDEHSVAIVMLEVKGLVAGHGWGCVACGLPMNGASAVLCEACVDDWQHDAAPLRFACRGYPATDGRVPIEELTEPHVHDATVVH